MPDNHRQKWPFSKHRSHLLKEADREFADAKLLLPAAEVAKSPRQTWLDLAGGFERAASLYRQAALSLMARQAFEYASHCYHEAGDPDDSERCVRRAEHVPVYWEKNADE